MSKLIERVEAVGRDLLGELRATRKLLEEIRDSLRGKNTKPPRSASVTAQKS